MNIGALVASLGIDPSGVQEGVQALEQLEKTANAKLSAVDKRLVSVGNTMKSVGKTMTMALTTSIIGVGTAAFAMNKDFEASMFQIIGLVGESREQVNAWSKDILTMAPGLGKAPKELADALFFVTSAGIKGAEAMDVLEMSARASASGLGETKVIADLVTSAMNAYGKDALDASKATDILVSAVREGKAEASALAPALGKVLPIASQMGVSFDQVAATVAAMTRTGTEATEATTQLRAIFNAFLKPSEEANKQLAMMGTSATELRKSMREDGLLATLTRLKDLSAQYGEEAMSKVIPSVEALGGVFNLVGANAADNAKIFESLTKTTGALDKAFETASETAEFKYNQTLAATKTAMVAIGDVSKQAVIPIMERVAKVLQTLANWFSNLATAQQRLVLIFSLVAAAAGPVLYVLGLLVSNIIPMLITGVKAATMAMKGLTMAMIKNPLTAFLVALTAIVAALVAFRNKAKDAADANAELNKTIQEGINLQNQAKSIEDKVRAARSMDMRQLQALREEIQRQIEAEKDHSSIIVGESKRRLESNIEYQNKLTEYQAAAEKIRLAGANMSARQAAQAYAAGIAGQLNNLQESILKEETITHKASQDRIKALYKYAAEVTKVMEGITEKTTSTIPESPLKPIIAELRKEMRFIEEMGKAFGSSYDVIESKIKAIQSSIQQGLQLEGITAANTQIQSWIKELTRLEQAQKQVAAVQIGEDVTKELAHITAMTSNLGDTFDGLSESSRVYESALKELITLFPEGSTAITQYKTALEQVKTAQEEAARQEAIVEANKRLQQQFEMIAARAKLMGNEFNVNEAQLQAVTAAWETMKTLGASEFLAGLEEQWKTLNEAVKQNQADIKLAAEEMQQLQQIYDQVGSTLSNVFSIMGEGLAEGTVAWQEMGSAILGTIQQIISGLLAKAIAGMIAGEASKGLLGLATATIGIAALKSVWDSQVKNVPRAFNGAMAYGDTLLRVGDYAGAASNPEVIAPLNDLKSYLPDVTPGAQIKTQDTAVFPDKVILQASGSTLYGIWEKEYIRRGRNT